MLDAQNDTGDGDEEERHSQRSQQRLMYKMMWKRATWMQKSFTRNVLVVFGGVTCCVGPHGNGVMWKKKFSTRRIPRSTTSEMLDVIRAGAGRQTTLCFFFGFRCASYSFFCSWRRWGVVE